jgi:hypothetical protein
MTVKAHVSRRWAEGWRNVWLIYEDTRKTFPHKAVGWNYIQKLCKEEKTNGLQA